MMDNTQIQALGGNFTIDSILSHQKACQNAPPLSSKRDYLGNTIQPNQSPKVSEMTSQLTENTKLQENNRSTGSGKRAQNFKLNKTYSCKSYRKCVFKRDCTAIIECCSSHFPHVRLLSDLDCLVERS